VVCEDRLGNNYLTFSVVGDQTIEVKWYTGGNVVDTGIKL
jgi:hypothetical protein